MESTFTVSRLARQFGVAPQKISDLFYRRKLSDEVCPVVDGRRQIPAEYVPIVERALRDHGILKNQETAHAG